MNFFFFFFWGPISFRSRPPAPPRCRIAAARLSALIGVLSALLHPQTWGLQAAGEDPEGWLGDGLDIIGGFGLAVAERTPMYRNLDFHFGPVLTHSPALYPPRARARRVMR